MKILITGGAGFIGSAIAPRLTSLGHEVYIIDDLSFGNRDFVEIPEERFFVFDILEFNLLKRKFQLIQPDVIIHLAAVHFIPYCNKYPFESAKINIQGTQNVINASKELTSLKKLFFASTAAVYPIFDNAINEDADKDPLDIYGLTKLTGEFLMKNFHETTGVSTVVCRFFNAFGPNETNPHLIPEIEKQLRNGERRISLGNTEPKRDFIHTYDMANAITGLIEDNSIDFDVFNLGRGIEYSVLEVVKAFSDVLGERIEIVQDKSRMRKSDRMHLLADVSKLKDQLGWEPEWSLKDGIRDLIEKW